MQKKLFLFLFLFLGSFAYSDDSILLGVNSAYTKTVSGNNVTFTLNSGLIPFFSESISVIDSTPENIYSIVIPSGTTLLPCGAEADCTFSSANPSNYVIFDSSINGIIIDGGKLNLNNSSLKDSLNLIIEGNLTAKNSAEINSVGANGLNGKKVACSLTAGSNAGKTGNIEIQEEVFVLGNSSLTIDSSGGSGGTGGNGFDSNSSCQHLDATNGGNGSAGGEILIEKLVFADSTSRIFFNVNGGNGGIGGTGASGQVYDEDSGTNYAVDGADGKNGLAESAGKIILKEMIITGNPSLGFTAFKGTGINSDSSELNDGIVSFKGCDLKNLTFQICKAERVRIYSNDSIELMNSLSNGEPAVCERPRTQIQPKLNCDCYSESGSTETDILFSLTGTAETFTGNLLAGNFNNFILEKDLITSTETINSDSGSYSFYNGFFNFSFGKNQLIFSNQKLNFGPFTYLLSFTINTLIPVFSDSSKGNFILTDYTIGVCGE